MATWKTPNTSHTVEDQVTPDIFNTLAENEIYLKDTKIVSSQVQDGAVTSTESTTRVNIASGDTVKVAFGKLRKWFSDFGVLCFLDKVDTDQIEPTSVTMGKIASNAVSTGKLDGLAVTTAKIANAAVTDVKIATNSVITEKILDLAVTTTKLADLAVTSAKLATSAVTTAKIADLNVTTAKLANGSVTTAKLADGAVTTGKIADGAITMAKLSGITQDAITGDIHAKTADNVLKNADGTYTPLVEGSDGVVISGNKIVKTKEPFYIGKIGTYYDDYELSSISGDNFPTPGQRYEVVYRDNSVKRSYEFVFPEKSQYSYVYLYFCLMFGVTESLSDCKIDPSAYDTATYKAIMWKIDHTNKKIYQTRVAAGYSIYSSTTFYGMYKVNEPMGALN